ncbi:MAG: cob(I)yrinic acid a,c-diamide adenosyltransferase [Firmicutes bacterium]|nr:cob(I)yrinic acid a,c-diamide adenosyltransferase [Bacillota bacterium]
MYSLSGGITIITGNGKGKTTTALGESFRFWGEGKKVLVLQFIKGATVYGEYKAAAQLGPDFIIKQLGLGFVRFAAGEELEKHKTVAKQALVTAGEMLKSGVYDLIILDEILYCVKFGLFGAEDVVELVKLKPGGVDLILTGRDAPEELIALADSVIEARETKHHLAKGIKAQKGIEF